MNLADFTESAVQAKTALYEYLALPDAAAIASRMRPASSASTAAGMIVDANKEAWRIRLEMAKMWDEGTMARVDKMLDAEVGKVPFQVRHLHPITGPLMSARFPDGAFAKIREQALLMMQKEQEKEEADKRESAKQARLPARRKGGKKATESRERTLMVRCVDGYVKWAGNNSHPLRLGFSNQFPKPEGITRTRIDELLSTLIHALNTPSLLDGLCERLQQRGFPNATAKAVAECMALLTKEQERTE